MTKFQNRQSHIQSSLCNHGRCSAQRLDIADVQSQGSDAEDPGVHNGFTITIHSCEDLSGYFFMNIMP